MLRRMISIPAFLLTATASTNVIGQMPKSKVVVAEARLINAAASITLVATVSPKRQSTIGSEMAGIVAEMPVREGDFVASDGVLCRLNDDTLHFRLVEAKARLRALSARHEEWVTGTRPEELARLKATLDEALAEVERWRFEMDRVEKLFAGRDSNAKEVHDTRTQLAAAEQRRNAAHAAHEMGVNGPRKETIEQAAHQVAEQQAVVDRLEKELAKTIVRAPFSGHIVRRLTEVGEWIPAGGPVVSLMELKSVLVRTDVPESTIPFVAPGQSARVTIDALNQSFGGTVRHVIRGADPRARTFPVDIEVENPDGIILAGMFARATLPAGPKQNVVAVPRDAIVERAGTTYVATIIPSGGPDGGHSGILQPVTLGSEGEDWVAITSANLSEGTRVITRGNENMQPFPMPVEIVDERGVPIAMPQPTAPEKVTEGGA